LLSSPVMPTAHTSDFQPEVGTPHPPAVRGARSPADVAGRYLTFDLAGQRYGFEILDVREIVGLGHIVPLPRAPLAIRGVLDLRGKIIPVLDLRVRFGLEPADRGEQSAIIVLDYQCGPRRVTTGVLVDRVEESVAFEADAIVPVPEMGGRNDEVDFLLGVGRSADGVVFLLDAARVLSTARSPILAGFAGRP